MTGGPKDCKASLTGDSGINMTLGQVMCSFSFPVGALGAMHLEEPQDIVGGVCERQCPFCVESDRRIRALRMCHRNLQGNRNCSDQLCPFCFAADRFLFQWLDMYFCDKFSDGDASLDKAGQSEMRQDRSLARPTAVHW